MVRRIGSAGIESDGTRTRIGGVTSFLVLVGTGGYLRCSISGPATGLVITGALGVVGHQTVCSVGQRLLDAVYSPVLEQVSGVVELTTDVI